ncbi:N-6 DNA methylase [Catellatospora chokoriensis]|uniref:SAM-dependent methyltransferase n=1 Tax=Catellatospora chokoriensis TaxID=310353 RepID=A0A8J3NT05_9ACTN|nr:N-6 DNA methylase [Catellatospora chokoriensis]GIF91512.1 SAM-dependent methyltransferase [Catellatospora chokoriensis]
MESTAEVTAGEIARLAGVGRAAVSNWRKRYADFPQAVGGTTASPTFRLVEVERWLTANDRMPVQSGVERLWAALQHSSTDPDREIPPLVRTLLGPQRDVGTAAKEHRAALAIADEIGREAALAGLVDRFVDLRGRRGSVATSPQVAGLIAELAAPAGKAVLDPACRSGALLAAAVADGAAMVAGQDPDLDNVAIAQARLHFATARVEVRQGSLQHDAYPDLQADVVISDPPTGGSWGYDELAADLRWEYSLPPRNEAELAWVQHALARLRPGGAAILLLPPGVAERAAGRRIRRELLRRGALRAVIALPSGVTAPYNTRLHLWLLRRPDNVARTRDVLMVDADGTWAEAVETIRAAVAAYEKGLPLSGDLAGRAAVVEAVSLSSEDVDLTPSRHVVSGQAMLSAEAVKQRREELVDLLGGLAEAVPVVVPSAESHRAGEISVGELAKAGLVSIHTEVDLQLRAGDVLVPAIGPRPRVSVAGRADEGRPLGPQTFLVRAEGGQVDPWFLAGFIGVEANLKRITSMGSIPRVDVRKAQVPRLPVDRQRLVGDMFRKIREFEDLLRLALSTGEEVTQMVAEGLASGTLGSEL